MLNWNSNTLATWYEELTHWKGPWCWERLKAGGKGDDRGWDGWMASPTQWTWVWANSERWWRTGKPGVLQSMGSQRVRHNRATELNWIAQVTLLSALWWPKWNKNPKKRGYVYTYGWFTLLYSRNQHNTVKQLYTNKKIFFKPADYLQWVGEGKKRLKVSGQVGELLSKRHRHILNHVNVFLFKAMKETMKNIPQQGRAGRGGTWLLQEASLPWVELGLKLWVVQWTQGHWESGEPTARTLAGPRASEPLPDEPRPHQVPLLHHSQSPLLHLSPGARMLMTPHPHQLPESSRRRL